MASLKFQARIFINGVNPYVHVDAAKAATLKKGWRGPMPVAIRINDMPTKPWRINMMPAGDGNFYLYLHGDVRKASHTKVGDDVTVSINFDNEYVPGPDTLPDFFIEALSDDAAAAAHWKRLPPSRQKEVVRHLNRLKSSSIQMKNLEQLMYVLSGNEGRFIGRSWKNGS